MNGIDWLFFCVPSDYRERLLNAFLMIWLIDEAITCLTIFCIECRDWLEYGPEGSWESFASSRFRTMWFSARATVHRGNQRDTSRELEKWRRQQFSFRSFVVLRCEKLLVIPERVCVVVRSSPRSELRQNLITHSIVEKTNIKLHVEH